VTPADRERLGRVAWVASETSQGCGRFAERTWLDADPDVREAWCCAAEAVLAANTCPCGAPFGEPKFHRAGCPRAGADEPPTRPDVPRRMTPSPFQAVREIR
jgi:hypothetical protein